MTVCLHKLYILLLLLLLCDDMKPEKDIEEMKDWYRSESERLFLKGYKDKSERYEAVANNLQWVLDD